MHVGDRASLTCSVTKGDLPLTITWKKDGRILNAGSSVSITEVDQFTSILVIESLSPEHNGNYSCVVKNAAAEAAHTQQLAVNGKHLSLMMDADIWWNVDFGVLFDDFLRTSCFSLSVFVSGELVAFGLRRQNLVLDLTHTKNNQFARFSICLSPALSASHNRAIQLPRWAQRGYAYTNGLWSQRRWPSFGSHVAEGRKTPLAWTWGQCYVTGPLQ